LLQQWTFRWGSGGRRAGGCRVGAPGRGRRPGARIFAIGGADQVSYGDIMREYGRQRGLDRLMIRVRSSRAALRPLLGS